VTELRPLSRAVLDSNVIFSRVLHELFGRLALEARLLDLVWSEELLVEASTALQERKGLDAAVADRWVGHLRRAFPEGQTDLARLPAAFTADEADQFVCALALAGDAQLLLTFDRGYLDVPLRGLGVEVVHPDVWLTLAVAEEPALVVDIVTRQAAVWGGGRPVPELLDAFERACVPTFAERVRDEMPLR
jgi:predicted nucleic acid-binding protein